MPDDRQQALARRLRRQADWCGESGENLYAGLLRRSADDAESGGLVWYLLKAHASEPAADALPLRFLAGVNRLVLGGRVPELAAAYAARDPEAAWPLFRIVLEEHREYLAEQVERPCQTNEVGRSAALLGGFLELAQAWQLPLRVLEVGASAGLNLRWDHYRYEAGDAAWGDPDSPVCLGGAYAFGEIRHDFADNRRELEAMAGEAGGQSDLSVLWVSVKNEVTVGCHGVQTDEAAP